MFRRRERDEDRLSLIFDVTEELVRQFGDTVSRRRIQQCVLQALVEQAGVPRSHDLREVVTSLATFRLMAAMDTEPEVPEQQRTSSE